MATFRRFNSFVESLAEKNHNLATDTLGVILSLTEPSSSYVFSEDVYAIGIDMTNSTGGSFLTQVSSEQTEGVYKLVLSDKTITASGGSLPAFRYVTIFNATSDYLIGYYDYGSSVVLQNGDQFVINFDGTNGILQLT